MGLDQKRLGRRFPSRWSDGWQERIRSHDGLDEEPVRGRLGLADSDINESQDGGLNAP